MTNRVIQKLGWLVVILLLLAGPVLVSAGGWAVVTLDELPLDVVVEQPLTVSFAVRQHGLHLVSELSPTVTAVHAETGESIAATAEAGEKDGYYVATLAFPVAGTWRWSIDAFNGPHQMPDLQVQAPKVVPVSGAGVGRWFLDTLLTWPFVIGVAGSLVAVALFAWLRRRPRWALALFLAAAIVGSLGFVVQWDQSSTAVAQASPASVAAVDAAEMGQDLFVAKGCVACHRHEAVGRAGVGIGPNLSNYTANAAFLRLWLKDPADIRPRTRMPDLELSGEEIEALIAFLSVDGE